MEFIIRRRYSEFRKLFQLIVKKYKEIVPFIKEFPDKKIFNSLEDEVIEARRRALQEFLNTMSKYYYQYFCTEFLEFLKVRG